MTESPGTDDHGAEAPIDVGPDRRRFWTRLIGVGLLIVGLVGFASYQISLQTRDPANPTALQPGDTVRDLFLVKATVLVRAPGEQGDVERFRPGSGAVLGEDVVFVDALAGTLLVLDASDAVSEVVLELPRGEAVIEPQFTAVAVSGTGTLLLADLANGQVWIYDAEGRFLGPFLGTAEKAAAGLTKPVALAVDGVGQTYVADVGDQTVKVLNKAGGIVRILGTGDLTSGRLDHPTGVVVDGEGYVYVADSNNQRVQVFDPEGLPERVISVTRGSDGLRLPRSLALDSQGRLHVVDAFAERVLVFERDGTFVGGYGAGEKVGERLSLPEGIVAAGEKVVIGDRGNGRLVVYGE